jgi:hypothetical protein
VRTKITLASKLYSPYFAVRRFLDQLTFDGMHEVVMREMARCGQKTDDYAVADLSLISVPRASMSTANIATVFSSQTTYTIPFS